MELFKELIQYGHDDNMGKTYPDGTTAFANGESAMLLQGIWNIGDIKKANPDIDLGIFPYPVGDAKVVSGVDLLFSVSETSKNQDAAMKFIDFLLTQDVAKRFIDDQRLFSAVKGVSQDAPELEGVSEAFAAGNVIDFPDHYIPASMDLASVLQQFAVDQDVDATLEQMDVAFEAYMERQ
jgi:raffinose/stachyose/melibiose transport system substrate-binding protein